MKSITNYIATGVVAAVISYAAISGLFFSRNEGNELRAQVVDNRRIITRQYSELRDKIDSIKDLIIKLRHESEKPCKIQ
jgi:hypothetical protein